jgi:large subunit ribosomal protein L24
MSLRIRKGDKVRILAGRDRGKTGKVIHVYPKKERALVEGVNMVKKHARKSQQNPQGAILHQEMPMHISNLCLLDPISSKPTRIKTLVASDGSKQRVAAKSKAVFGL